MSCELIIELPTCEVTTENIVEAEALQNVCSADIENTIEAEAQLNEWVITSDDVYIVKYSAEVPPWLEEIIEDVINNSPLAGDVGDLEDLFDDFEDGVTKQIGYLKEEDQAIAWDVSVLKVTTDNNTAGIQHLDIVKTTEDEARAISQSTIAAWQSGAGGAWFQERIEVVSNVAYSAAKSSSTLSASIISQSDQITAIIGDIDMLEKQVDGKVETWFSEANPVNPDGSIKEDVEPYASWLAAGTQDIHTGDTYVYFEYDAANPSKKNILVTFRFAYDTDLERYEWYVFEDDLASAAYQQALDAQALADGKSVIYWQPEFPYPSAGELTDVAAKAEADKNVGDVLVDSDDGNKMWRYNRNPITGGESDDTPVTYAWGEVDDRRIHASVNRLDEATVDVNGEARAKSSLSVDANGVIGGFIASSDGRTSRFRIFADEFTVTNRENGSDAGAPFSIDTQTNEISFNGTVKFEDVSGTANLATMQDLAGNNGTVISGGAIVTNTINADRITANTFWVDGKLQAADGSFVLKSGALGTNSDPNIYGAYIKAGTLSAGRIATGSIAFDEASGMEGPIFVSAPFSLPNTPIENKPLGEYRYDITAPVISRGATSICAFNHRVISSNVEIVVNYNESCYMQGLDNNNFHCSLIAIVYSSDDLQYGTHTIAAFSRVAGNLIVSPLTFSGTATMTIPTGGYVRLRRGGTAYYGGFHGSTGVVTVYNL